MKFNCVTPVPSAISLIFSPWAVLPPHISRSPRRTCSGPLVTVPGCPPEFLETVALRRRFCGPVAFLQPLPVSQRCLCLPREGLPLAAPSGVGKTTQLNLWWQLYPGEITIINGDKPALQFQENGPILVHATPWRGKEALGGTGSAPWAESCICGRARQTGATPCRLHPPSCPYWVSVFAQTGPKPTTGCFCLCSSGWYLLPPFGCWKTGEGRNLHGSAMITY